MKEDLERYKREADVIDLVCGTSRLQNGWRKEKKGTQVGQKDDKRMKKKKKTVLVLKHNSRPVLHDRARNDQCIQDIGGF